MAHPPPTLNNLSQWLNGSPPDYLSQWLNGSPHFCFTFLLPIFILTKKLRGSGKICCDYKICCYQSKYIHFISNIIKFISVPWWLVTLNTNKGVWVISGFNPSALRAEGVLSSPPSVCPSVRLSVCLSNRNALVTAITHHRFQLWTPNSHQLCILGYIRLISKMGVIDCDL